MRRSSFVSLFYDEFRREFHDTGAILPSSRFLAKALTRHVMVTSTTTSAPRSILEVGPGTGAVTEWIVKSLRLQDRLDLVEVNPRFVSCLNHRFSSEARLIAVADQVRILNQPVESLAAANQYDLVVSGLPLNNFAAQHTDELVDLFPRLLKPNGRISFFEYVAIRKLRTWVSGSGERHRLLGVGKSIRRCLEGGNATREIVWINVPPAWVYHVEMGMSSTVD